MCLPGKWCSIDNGFLPHHYIELHIVHNIFPPPGQIHHRDDLVHDVLCDHPVPHFFCELGPFFALTERERHFDYGVFITLLAILDVTVSRDICSGVGRLEVGQVPVQVPHGSMPGPNMEVINLVLPHC